MNKKFFFIFSIVMAIGYFIFGIYIIFFDGFAQLVASKEMRYFFGAFLIVYGMIRSWRSYTFVKHHKDINETN
jgi:hypothetical protein